MGVGLNICTVCGGDLQSCCPMNNGFSSRCDADFACVPNAGDSVCRAECGSLGQPCCDDLPGGDGCGEDGLECGPGDTCVEG